MTCTYTVHQTCRGIEKAFKIRREDIRGEFIFVFFVLSLYLDRREGDDEEQ